jgi:anti-sigma factor (TIGR02949 family)
MARYDRETTCAWARQVIEAYLDGDLTADEAAKLESHLSGCQSCAEELALAKQVNLALRALPEQRCPDRIRDAVLDRVAKQRSAVRRSVPVWTAGRHPRVWRPAAFAAALLVVVIAVLVQKGPQPPPATVTPEELVRAEQQVRWTLAYVGEIGRRSAFTVRDDVFESRVVSPIRKAFSDIFEEESTS